MKIASVVGARPQFIKCAPVSRALRQVATEVLIHTGQHYDDNMSDVFFRDLVIPTPDYNLGVGSGPHGAQTGGMLAQLEEVFLKERPDWVLVYGDTNSTLAGALAAAKLHLPVAHVEAGLRSFNRRMPEEINRVLTDHVSALLFCPTETAVRNLVQEGITEGVHLVGDVMHDALLENLPLAESTSRILERLGLRAKEYILATIHRAENTDDPERLAGIAEALRRVAALCPVVWPIHPRARQALGDEACRILSAVGCRMMPPVSYLDMLALERSARVILTDSGGVQKEAWWLGVPCVTLRDETEWAETVQSGWNVIAGTAAHRILPAVKAAMEGKGGEAFSTPDTRASEQLAALLTGQRGAGWPCKDSWAPCGPSRSDAPFGASGESMPRADHGSAADPRCGSALPRPATDTQLQESEIRPDGLMKGQAQRFAADIRRLMAQKAQFVDVGCPACGGVDRAPAFEKCGMVYVTCRSCDSMYVSPRPTPAILERYYATSENYAYWNEHIFPASAEARREKIFKPRAARVLSICARHGVPTRVLLEVGAGFGMFLEEIRNDGRFERVIGVEPTPDLARTCREKGFEIIEEPIERVKLDRGAVDVLVSFEVIEHLFAPRDFLASCSALLEPGGLLVLTCPNVKGFDVAMLGPASDTVDVEHLNYFHPASLSRLVTEADFEVLEITTPGLLDAELVRRKVLAGHFGLAGQPLLKQILVDRWAEVGPAFQRFLAENGLSSHMWLCARRM